MNKILRILITLLCFCALSFAQSTLLKTEQFFIKDLVLEVTFMKNRPPAFQSFSEKELGFGSTWYSLFGQISNFQPNDGDMPVRAVNVVSKIDKNSVIITVSVFTGKEMFEKEIPVAVYSLKENERVVIKELKSFGVEPFEFSLIRLDSAKAALPTIINYTKSLHVTKIEPAFSTLPTYNIQLLNNSNKPILAFAFETTVENRKSLSGLPQGKMGQILIEPGKRYEVKIRNSLDYSNFEKGTIPPIASNQNFIIKSVVFADGTYEGDNKEAALFLSFTVGRKIILKELINLIEKFEATDSFISKIESLRISIDEKVILENSQGFLLPIAESSVIIAINGEKIRFSQEFRKIKDKGVEQISEWLNQKKTDYKNWLDSLP